MKTASSALISLLNSGTQFIIADLYDFVLVDGTTLRYTSADKDLTVSGNVYSSAGVKLDRGKTRIVVGVQVDTLDISAYANPTDTIGATPFIQSLGNGALDGAQVTLWRIVMPTFGDTSTGPLWLFSGQVAEIAFGRMSARIRVKSDLQLLNAHMPRNVYQAGCLHTLYDSGCTLNRATFAITGTVSSATLTSITPTASLGANGYFDLGIIKFTSGANNGVSMTVKQYTSGVFTLMRPLNSVSANGDTFTAYPGCDKLQATCTAKFNNLNNFRGFPYVPIPETAY